MVYNAMRYDTMRCDASYETAACHFIAFIFLACVVEVPTYTSVCDQSLVSRERWAEKKEHSFNNSSFEFGLKFVFPIEQIFEGKSIFVLLLYWHLQTTLPIETI